MNKLMMAAMLAVFSGGVVHAATDGTVNTSSTGTLGVTLGLTHKVLVAGLDDSPFQWPTYVGTGDLSGTSAFCIGQNYDGNVNLRFTSAFADGAGAFRLRGTNNNANFLPYAMRWQNGVNAGSNSRLAVSNQYVNGLTVANRQDLNCGADNMSVYVSILATDIAGANVDDYSDTITVLVEAI